MTGECLKLTQLWTLIYKKLPTLRAHKTLVNLWQISVLMHRFSPKQRFLWKKTRNKKTLPVLFPLPWLHIFCSSPARSVKQRSWLETWLPKWLIFGIIGGAKKMWCSFYGFSGRKLGWFHQIGGYKTWGVKRMGGGGYHISEIEHGMIGPMQLVVMEVCQGWSMKKGSWWWVETMSWRYVHMYCKFHIPHHVISHYIVLYHIISYHIISYHIISYHIISLYIYNISYILHISASQGPSEM